MEKKLSEKLNFFVIWLALLDILPIAIGIIEINFSPNYF